MLKNIKSSYFCKAIFDYLDEGIKLKLIKNNKYFQNMMNINLLNYKYFIGKYLIYDKKHKQVIEADKINDILIYRGEYLNGKRNGHGKECKKFGEIIFQGEYLNGIRWNGIIYGSNEKIICKIKEGKGVRKEYHTNNLLLFDGEYLNGQINGKTKIYYKNGVLMFDGEYLNGKKWNGKAMIIRKIMYILL